MKITIPLQTLLFCLLLLAITVVLGSYFMIEKSKIEEPFFDATSGNMDIQLQACPPGTESLNETTKGTVSCCDGTIVDGLCNGTTVCSLSTDSPTLPSCVNLLRKHFADKAAQFCPKSIPNYYEDVSVQPNKQGCTAGARTTNGSAPVESTTPMPRCTIYQNRKDNDNKVDSCQNIKAADNYRCPQGGRPQIVSLVPNLPVTLQCAISPGNGNMIKQCFEDTTWLQLLKAYFNGEQYLNQINTNSGLRLQFCSIAKKYYLDKSLTDAQLNSTTYNGTEWVKPSGLSTLTKTSTFEQRKAAYIQDHPDLEWIFVGTGIKICTSVTKSNPGPTPDLTCGKGASCKWDNQLASGKCNIPSDFPTYGLN